MSRLRGVSAKIVGLPRAQWARLRATLLGRPPSDRRAGSTTLGGATDTYGIRVLTGAIAAVALLAVIVPWSPGIIDVQDVHRLAIDLSALMVLADAFADGKRFGVDVVFPYGPLSFVRHNIFHPGTFDWLIVLRLLLWTGYGLVALRIASQARTRGAWCGTIVATAFVFCWLFGFLKEPAFLIAPILLQLLYVQDIASNSGRLRPATVLFVLCGAVLAYVKFSYFFGFALQLLLFAAVDIGIRRRWPVLSLVGFAALLAVWFVIGQRFDDLGAWLITSFDLSRGFNLEASLAGLKQGRWVEVLLLLLSAGVAVLLQAIWMLRKTENFLLTAILTLGTAGSAFIIFKYGVVRHDAHAAYSATTFAGLIVIQMLLFFQGARSSLKLAAAPAIVAVLGFNLWIVGNWDLSLPLPSAVLRKVETGLAALAFGDRRDRLNARYVAAQSHMAGLLPLEKPEGTVEVITNNPGIAIVNGWKLANRPSFLTQQTVSARSSRMNAAFLDSDAAPDTIVAMLHFSDHRYPGMSDPLLWFKLLEHYRAKSWRGDVVVLSRRDEPARLKRTPIATFTGKLNTSFDIPDEARKRLVWAEIDLRPTFIGSLINLIYKLPPPSIVVHTGDGEKENFRLVHYAARAGFLLSPTLTGPIPLIAMETGYRRPPIAHVVDSFAVTVSERWGFLFQNSFQVRLSTLSAPTASPLPKLAEAESRALEAALDVAAVRRRRDLQMLKNAAKRKLGTPYLGFRDDPIVGKTVLFAHAPQSMRLDIPANSRWLTLGYGMMASSYSHANEGDGVTFIVRGVSDKGDTVELFRRHLNPWPVKEDRGEHFADIDLGEGRFEQVLIEFDVGRQSAADHSFISEILFR